MKNSYILLAILAGLALAPACKKEKHKKSKVQMERGDGAAAAPAEPPLEVAALFDAIRAGHKDVVSNLLKDHPELVDSYDVLGRTPLIVATLVGNTQVVQLLITKGADVNAADRAGLTTLMFASRYGTSVIVELLLRAGADVNEVSVTCHTALDFASSRGDRDIVVLLERYGARRI